MKTTFLQLFCQQYGRSPAQYRHALFWRILYRHAIPLVPLLWVFCSEFFAPDYDLIHEVGLVTRRAELRDVYADFHHDSRNRNWLRSKLRLRASTRRLTRIVCQLIAEGPPGESARPGDSTPPELAFRARRSPPGTNDPGAWS